MADEKWGVGSKANDPAWGHSCLHDGTPLELVWGENPHSRQDNSVYARFPDGKVEAFDGHRPVINMQFESYNYLKESGLSGNEVRKAGIARVFANDEVVYAFPYRHPEKALHKMQTVLEQLSEHPSDVLLKGCKHVKTRKVYYQGVPATVDDYDPECGELALSAAEGHKFPVAPWDKEDGAAPEPCTKVRDDLLSPHVWWFRKGDTTGEEGA